MSKFMIGLDFGTTNTSISYMTYNNIENKYFPECFKFKGNDYIKSVITYMNDTTYWIGDAADQYKIKYPNGFIKSIKRKLIEKDKLNFKNIDKNYCNIITDIIKQLRTQIIRQLPLNSEIEGVVMGIPIGFTDECKNIYLNALTLAGFYNSYEESKSKTIFVSEPIGAVLDYNLTLNENKKIMVFDFGGGTLDIVVMQMNNIKNLNELKEHDVLTKGGIINLGGDDFDRKILEDIIADKIGVRKLKRSLEITSFADIENVQSGMELMKKIQIAKEELSLYNVTNISLKADDLYIDIDITRKEFELAISPYMKRIKEAVEECLSSANDGAGVRESDIDIVVLAGGSSLIPLVEDTLIEIFGESKVKINKDALTCISRGLALRGHNSEHTKYNDILDHSYGIMMLDEDGINSKICNVLKKSQRIKDINAKAYYKEFELSDMAKTKNFFTVTICEDEKEIGNARIPFNKNIMSDSKYKVFFVMDENLQRLELLVLDITRDQMVNVPINERYIKIGKDVK